MKKNQSIVTYLRLSAGCAFFAAAAALAFVATTTNVLTTHDVAATKRPQLAKSSIQASVNDAKAEASMKDGSVGTPFTAAAEEAAKRAYPADETPFTAQLNSITAFKRFMASSASNATPAPAPKGHVRKKNKKQPPEAPRFNTWSLIGPSSAFFPGILTFSGANYFTSGRVTAIALDTNPGRGCTASFCRLWIGAAGGGVWRTTNALATVPTWTFLTSLNVFSNAIGAMTFVDNGTANGVLYVGTGEPNASADSEAGLGIMKSLDGGDTWTQLGAQVGPITTNSPGTGPNGTYTGNAFFGRAISQIVIDPTNPNIIYVGSARGVRGIDETYGGPTSNPPVPRPPFGLYKSTDGGAHFTFIWDGSATCPAGCNGSDPLASIRGVTQVRMDPFNHNIIYASDFPGPGGAGSGGIWRSNDAGSTWTQILPARTPTDNVDRAAFDVGKNGTDTLMYAAVGNDGAASSHVFRSLVVQTGVPSFTDQTAAEVPQGQTNGTCTGQCWYDNVVTVNQDLPQLVWIGGSFNYGECGGKSNCRGVIVSQDFGNSWFDATWDATSSSTPNGLHPDQHAIQVIPNASNPNAPRIVFEGSDGGMMRIGDGSSFVNISGQCAGRGLAGNDLLLCQQLLSLVPPINNSMNQGLATLQFMSVSFNWANQFNVQGGTQDNGTFQTFGSQTWNQIMYGDGGQSGFGRTNSNLRFNTFTGQANDANFQNGNIFDWVVIGAPMALSPETSLFYPPIIADPSTAAAQTIFEGSRGVWRTQDWGGNQAFLEANCPEFTTPFFQPGCGDFQRLGGAPGTNNAGDLEGTFYGATRTGGNVNVIDRTTSNTNVAWAGSTRGRVFISTNVDTNPAANVVWNRLDPVGAADPQRVVTGIAIDPFNTFHAWVSYSGYNFNTPSQPGHVFSVSWSGAGTATWTNITGNLPDIPITSIVFDPFTGDLYVSCDFTVFRLAAGHTVWDVAGMGLPIVEVPHLTINPNARVIYAATHGLSVFSMPLY